MYIVHAYIILRQYSTLQLTIHKQQHDGGTVELEACLKDINSWCVSKKLVLNDRKTELIDLHIHSKFS